MCIHFISITIVLNQMVPNDHVFLRLSMPNIIILKFRQCVLEFFLVFIVIFCSCHFDINLLSSMFFILQDTLLINLRLFRPGSFLIILFHENWFVKFLYHLFTLAALVSITVFQFFDLPFIFNTFVFPFSQFFL